MKEYYVTVMSIDPMEDPDDNHQKYGVEVMAENETQAKELAKQDIESRGLPVYWTKVN